jgi:hypothetical protein
LAELARLALDRRPAPSIWDRYADAFGRSVPMMHWDERRPIEVLHRMMAEAIAHGRPLTQDEVTGSPMPPGAI